MQISGIQSISTGFAVPLTWFQRNQELEVIAEDWRRNNTLEVKVGIGNSNLYVPYTKKSRMAMFNCRWNYVSFIKNPRLSLDYQTI